MIPHPAGTIRRSAAGGFTLLEVLLVLGILVLLAAVAWPSLSRPLAATRLREGARGVCNEIARARLRAIETGNVLVLRCELGSRRYEIVTRAAALEGGDARQTDDQSFDTMSAQDGVSRTWPASAFVPVRSELPAGIRFIRTSRLETDPSLVGESLAEDEVAPVDDDLDFDSMSGGTVGDGGPAVYLYPDGTARDATIRLANDAGASIEITLRGITGTTRLGTVVEPEVTR